MNSQLEGQIDKEIQARRKRSEPGWNAIQKHPPNSLYHYTSISGLQGIVETSTLWASDIFYLNDASEMAHAKGLFLNSLTQEHEKNFGEIHNEFFRIMVKEFAPSSEHIFSTYVACFTTKKDLLSQWRGYSSMGVGYSIGFKCEFVNNPNLALPYSEFTLRQVIYDRQYQKGLVSELIDSFSWDIYNIVASTGITDPTSSDGKLLLEKFCTAFRVTAAEYMVCLKHDSFCEEEEWRAVHRDIHNLMGTNNVKLRSTDKLLIPYVELDFTSVLYALTHTCKLSIEEVRHGPSVQPQLSKRSAELLLQKFNHASVSVTGSTIPLRA